MRSEALVGALLLFTGIIGVGMVSAQTSRTKKPAARTPAPAKPIVARPDVTCPTVLGAGVSTHREFCDVLVGRDPQAGIIIRFPPHRDNLIFTFDLHNRQTVSAELVREKRAYTNNTATIGVLTLDNTLFTRAVVETTFRGPGDLFDRVGGGAGPSGVKAVAVIGDEPIRLEMPASVDEVSVLGEKLVSVTMDRTETVRDPGLPIATISNLSIEYLPPLPAKKKAPAKKKR